MIVSIVTNYFIYILIVLGCCFVYTIYCLYKEIVEAYYIEKENSKKE